MSIFTAIKNLFKRKQPEEISLEELKEKTIIEQLVDWSWIHAREGWREKPYVPVTKKGVVMGQSGVTIGHGIDLGQQSATGLAVIGVPQSIINKVKNVLGVKGSKAKELVDNLDLTLEEIKVLESCFQKAFYSSLKQMYNDDTGRDFNMLNKGQQTVLLSLLYNMGRKGLRNNFGVWDLVKENKWKEVPDAIEKAYAKKKNPELAKRRKAEADFLRKFV